jgi:hypothetical protein
VVEQVIAEPVKKEEDLQVEDESLSVVSPVLEPEVL